MAYRRKRRSTYRARGRGGYGRSSRSYRSGYRTRRRRVSRRASQRIVIQVVGGATGGVLTSPLTLGKKSYRPVRARF